MKISFFGNPQRRDIPEQLPGWLDWLREQGHATRVSSALGKLLSTAGVSSDTFNAGDENLLDGCDLLISLGGDGTILLSARLVGERNVPILGVKFGGLGFLADVAPDDFESAVSEVVEGKAVRQERHLLWGESRPEEEGELLLASALNDIVIHRTSGAQATRIGLAVDGARVGSFIADGLIVATPTGSTAYSMAAGGPIITPDVDALIITPICPHSLTTRPVVVSPSSIIAIQSDDPDGGLVVSADGRECGELPARHRFVVGRAEHRITLLHRAAHSFFNTIIQKLQWGEDVRKG